MKLDRVMLINLDRREDKYWFAMGVLLHLGYHRELIERFSAHDGQAYKSVKDVHDAAIADGFPIFAEWESSRKTQAAWFYTWCCALREIADKDKTTLLLIDDILPKPFWTYDRMSMLVGNCYTLDESFRIIQLMYTRFAHELYDPHQHYNTILAKGLAGSGDQANIFSPSGAAHLLDVCTKSHCPKTSHGSLEILFYSSDQTGLWHTIDEICGGLFGWDSDLATG